MQVHGSSQAHVFSKAEIETAQQEPEMYATVAGRLALEYGGLEGTLAKIQSENRLNLPPASGAEDGMARRLKVAALSNAQLAELTAEIPGSNYTGANHRVAEHLQSSPSHSSRIVA